MTYYAEDLSTDEDVAIKVEVEEVGRTSAAIFEEIQHRVGESHFFPKFRFYGILGTVEASDGSLKRSPTINTPQLVSFVQTPHQLVLLMLQTGHTPGQLVQLVKSRLVCTVMDFVRGIPLHEKSFPSWMWPFYLWQAAKGLCQLHKKGIIHGDIKPENILVDLGGRIRIIDFSTSRPEGIPSPKGTQHAISEYSPWEHFSDQPSRYSDIYGLGAVLYHLITGEAPEHRGASLSNVYCDYFSKLDQISEPWRALLKRVFYRCMRTVEDQGIFTRGMTIFHARLQSSYTSQPDLQPIETAEQLRDELSKLVCLYEKERRATWQQRREQVQQEQMLEQRQHWSERLQSIERDSNTIELVKEESKRRRLRESTFRQEWEVELEHRQEIANELGYCEDASLEASLHETELRRRAKWESDSQHWHGNALEQAERERQRRWDRAHDDEWEHEQARCIARDRGRSQLLQQASAYFARVRELQDKTISEPERRSLWQEQLARYDERNHQYRQELNQEKEQRRRAIQALAQERQTELQRRKKMLSAGVVQANLPAWVAEQEKREQTAYAELEPWAIAQERILTELETTLRQVFVQQEHERRAARGLLERLWDPWVLAGARLSSIVQSHVEWLTSRLQTIVTLFIGLTILCACAYYIWYQGGVPSLSTANQHAQRGINAHELAEAHPEADMDDVYHEALTEYTRASEIYRAYIARSPESTKRDVMDAHYNLSTMAWNSFLIVTSLDDESLGDPLSLLIEAERHLDVYNKVYPSQENEEKLLKYELYILSIRLENQEYSEGLTALETLVDRINHLGLDLDAEDQSLLSDLVTSICDQDLSDFQQLRCNFSFR